MKKRLESLEMSSLFSVDKLLKFVKECGSSAVCFFAEIGFENIRNRSTVISDPENENDDQNQILRHLSNKTSHYPSRNGSLRYDEARRCGCQNGWNRDHLDGRHGFL